MQEGGNKMSPVEKKAKMNAVHGMRKTASDMMAEPLHGLKKVSVASDSPEGLKMGLDKAKDVVDDQGEDGHEMMMAAGGLVEDKAPGMGEEHSNPNDFDEEELEEETGDDLEHDNELGEPAGHVAKVMEGHAEQHASDLSHLTPEEIDKKIHELSMMKALHKAKHG